LPGSRDEVPAWLSDLLCCSAKAAALAMSSLVGSLAWLIKELGMHVELILNVYIFGKIWNEKCKRK
jgi:hypothetical protein